MMNKLTTKILFGLCSLFLISNLAYSQGGYGSGGTPTSWDDDTFIIRFDPNTTAAEIEYIKNDYFAEELWVSPLTNTRLWQVPQGFPYVTQYTQLTIIDIQGNSNNGRSRAGSQGGSGLNYHVKSGTSVNQNPTPIGPINPNPSNPDTDLDCKSEMFTSIPAGESTVRLGVFDTGLSNWLDAGGNYYWNQSLNIDGYNYINGNFDFTDNHGHGNHVASSLLHLVNEPYYKYGLGHMPSVETRILKTFNSSAQGYMAEIIYAFETEVENGMNIANFSWRFLAASDEALLHPLYKTLQTAQDNYDVLIVCAAGNDGTDIDNGVGGQGGSSSMNAYPAAYDFDNILSVTTFDCVSALPTFANSGNELVDIAAPGLDIPGYWTDNFNQADIDYLSGTSMSTAIVTSVAVQLASHQSSFDAQEIKCAIMNGADYNSHISNQVFSDGLLNAPAAYDILGQCSTGGGNGGPRKNIGQDLSGSSQIVSGVYPNPSFGKFDLTVESMKSGIVIVNVFDNIGKKVLAERLEVNKGVNSLKIDATSLANGIYNMVLFVDGEKITHKVSILK